MATLNKYSLTMVDMLNRRTPDGKFDRNILDLLLQVNPILDNIPFVEANGGFTHVTTLRTGAHIPTWVALGEGVRPDKTSYNQIKASCGRMKSLVQIDGDTYDESLDANGKGTDATKAIVQDEIQAAAAGMRDEMAKTIFYGMLADEPRSFNGLASVFKKYGVRSDLSINPNNDKNDASFYCMNGGKSSNLSTAALRSIFFVTWGTNAIHGIYPGGTNAAALKTEALQETTVTDANGLLRKVYNAWLHWNAGICVRDYRTSGRIANIESDKMLLTTGQPNYLELISYFSMLPNQDGIGTGEFCMSKTVWRNLCTLFSRATRDNAIKYEDLEHRKHVPTLFGFRVQLCDALETNEEEVLSI